MENYDLKPNETVLFKCEAENGIEVILTNIDLVIIKRIKRLFSKEQVTTNVYAKESIKIYNGIPQIKQTDYNVEIFLTSDEIKVTFCTKSDARKFVSAAFELLTGKTASARGAEKVKNAIGLVDDTLGINTVDTVKNVLENGVTKGVLGIFGKKGGKSRNETIVGSAKDLLTTEQNAVTATENDNAVEKLKKLKDLLDAGIITQEEFDAKKQEILSRM